MSTQHDDKSPSRWVSSLRAEARAVEWEHLDDSQRTAIRRIATHIYDAVRQLGDDGGTTHPSGAVWRTTDRSSRLAFLHGERGSGKSTVLLSLVGEHPLETHDSELAAMLSEIRRRVIWLEPIDLEPVPDDINLLSAILARVDAHMYRSLDRDPVRWPATHLSSEIEKAHNELQRLQRDVCSAWGGNLDRRAPHLDLDTYAAEVEQLEKTRMSLNTRFTNTLRAVSDALGASTGSSGKGGFVFVLAVDDFDLNPAHSTTLLRYLRSISTPRLFTLLIGDFDVLSLVATMDATDRMFKLATNVFETETLPVTAGEIGSTSAEISYAALRKLLPPTQRVELAPRTPANGLAFSPLDADKAAPTLEARLAEVLLPSGYLPFTGSISNLRDLLLARVIVDGNALAIGPTTGPASSLPYLGHNILRMSLRRTNDLYMALTDSRWREAGTKAGASLVALLMRQSMDLAVEDRGVTPMERRQVVRSLRRDPEEFEPTKVPFRARATRGRAKAFALATPETEVELSVRMLVQLPSSLRVDTGPRRPELPGSLSGMLALLNDLGYLSLGSPRPMEAETFPGLLEATSEWIAIELTCNGATGVCYWPRLPIHTFWAADVCRGAIQEIITSASQLNSNDTLVDDVVAMLCHTWISLGCSIFDGKPIAVPAHIKPDAKLIATLADRVASLAVRSDAQIVSWVASIAHLTTAECGAVRFRGEASGIAVVMQKVIDSPEIQKLWNRHAPLLRRQRAARLGKLYLAHPDLAETFRNVLDQPIQQLRVAEDFMKDAARRESGRPTARRAILSPTKRRKLQARASAEKVKK